LIFDLLALELLASCGHNRFQCMFLGQLRKVRGTHFSVALEVPAGSSPHFLHGYISTRLHRARTSDISASGINLIKQLAMISRCISNTVYLT